MEEDITNNGGDNPQDNNQNNEPQGSWRDNLSEGLRNSPVLAKYDSQESAHNALIHAQSVIGKKGLVAPGEGATAEVLSAYRSARRGGIQSPDAYKTPADFTAEKLASVGLDDAAMKSLRQTAFNIGLDADGYGQFVGAAYGNIVAAQNAMQEQQKARLNELTETLKAEWGDRFQQRLDDGKAFMEQAGIWDAVLASGLAADENFVRFIDEAVRVTTREGGLPRNNNSKPSPREAMKNIANSEQVSNFRNPEGIASAVEAYKRHCREVAAQAKQNSGRLSF